MQYHSKPDCLIIGGGLTGLIAGIDLQTQGLTVKLLDKGRGIGGRFATRRMSDPEWGEARFDYGVQFLSAKTETFQQWLKELQQQGIVKSEWDQYWGVDGIRGIAKHLASNLNIQNQTKVVHLAYKADCWRVTTEEGTTNQSRFLLLTPPVPQSLELLKNSNLLQPNTNLETLDQVTYYSCLTVLLLVSRPILIKPALVEGEKLKSIICNYQKGISPHAYAVTLQGNAAFSEKYLDPETRESGAEELMTAARNYLGEAEIIDHQVHFWRYSTPKTQFNAPFFASSALNLYLAGDGFSSGDSFVSSAESAFLSGLAVAKQICNQLS
ncbi:FAD dependent oxidoreductase [Halothece sp. PCC 7418]|uniref:NAD(P)/FAD-dependent oxidoreductase n=1 Tax=Halothece sp. (strain PCC 7418) TaxID=65093 RepID=UPI0002A06C72|nr:FAD-dependent oxidoreductase [Halothece sp. PCC 7418]AFZ44760.1 FAD dependent oxidoreductase [Halothece sp. PCC 7418]